MKKNVREASFAVLNLFLIIGGFLLTPRFVNPDHSYTFELDREPGLLVGFIVTACAVGALSGLWSRRLISIVIPSFFATFLMLGLLNFAMALAFSLGQSTPQFWPNFLDLSESEFLSVISGTVLSGITWWLVRTFVKPRM